jgi:hypothetical protein
MVFGGLRLRHRIIRLRSPPAENPCTREKTPWEVRKAQDQARALEKAKTTTFQECAWAYIKARRSGWKNAKHAEQWSATLETWAYPIIGKLPVGGISTDLVLKVLEQPVGDQADAPTFWTARTGTASRVRGRIENVLDWAKAKKLRDGVRRQPTRCDRKVLQAFSASANVLKGEPPTLMAGLFK